MNDKLSIIGAPTDIGAGSRGASMGPEALRVANIVPVLPNPVSTSSAIISMHNCASR